MDVSSVVMAVQEQIGSIVAIGTAVLLLLVVIKSFRWIRVAVLGSDDGGRSTHYGASFAASSYHPDNYDEWARRETLASREYEDAGK